MPDVRLADIASQIGVSVSTVSRALSAKGHSSSKGQRQIIRVAREMGYGSGQAASEIGLGKVMIVTVGFTKVEPEDGRELTSIMTSLQENLVGRLVYGAEHAVAKRGGHLLVSNLPKTNDVVSRIARLAKEAEADGILLSIQGDMGGLDQLAKLCPVVQINAPLGEIEIDAVASDDFGGIGGAVRRLFSLGHRRIGFWMDIPPSSSRIERRLDGYRTAMKMRGGYERLYLDERATGLAFPVRMQRAFDEFRVDDNRPTAIICANDLFASTVLRMATEQGVRVPEDLSIVGFDNSETCEHTYPRLSSIDQQLRQMPEIAVGMLVERVAKPNSTPRQLTLSATLVERETIADIR
ncbi:MAG: LacI family DNA-binding transcriptional regulator [Capsulimonadaceae bacterium]|nr:LacI family DNA-binding transcriptional regulator [Capsulimonadaceae bacterium]